MESSHPCHAPFIARKNYPMTRVKRGHNVLLVKPGALSINGLKHEAAKRASEPIKGFHEGMGEETADELRARWYS
ncbi:hypothetical protein KGM_206671 [Danaus plexippus plexippus]|uniref:Uncharacterized protein n=1 Tax=Danaus plexippus plexippus TaxID=278856 RepID=A0A212EZD4_DANPL|nr:hypothetical protein KGM_206671 [Danaus plexippus plexippus]